ncbi:hypothetical protein GCM10010365_20580 [Streptomyces poonensis]|uniref:Uncharacterized protein n=1 Tax=Streptomyces poonensis TaxID=68255 RepID=A0A918UEP7_9ACTN|nr:hypothetical protein GCM10010365_20580 [Streptomyces poonensis]GLJ90328.1 hypothetical protein GCM10017589_29310 [Streptomyces poonensis]
MRLASDWPATSIGANAFVMGISLLSTKDGGEEEPAAARLRCGQFRYAGRNGGSAPVWRRRAYGAPACVHVRSSTAAVTRHSYAALRRPWRFLVAPGGEGCPWGALALRGVGGGVPGEWAVRPCLITRQVPAGCGP